MIIKRCYGYELEKEKRNTSEDFFNRSEVTFEVDGVEKTLHILYVRYFDEIFTEYTPFKEEPIATIGEKEYNFRDIVALACLLGQPTYQERKRVYISSEREFAENFQGLQVDKIKEILQSIEEKGSYRIAS